ncbi:ARM repeat-containing protein [Suillus plorans]|uniref:ARM repeat-containing protein n=1 Tax=Suillus plorans TaxID=116603 RepID=A0A9P7E3B1_9AGAM|nr:ARM repeat-containing protein [Suillus plorans]KAG1810178.1 ARM repeat-containing protein [Suillus plorans]
MGKSQKKRSMRRHNPMRVPDSHLPKGLESAASSSPKNEAVLPIIQKLENPDASERKWACVAVSNLIQNDPSTRRLLQGKNVVGALITRLSDSEEEVWIEAAGALRNLCIDGGYDICAEMYNKNILAPLKAFVPKISSALSQFLESPKTAPENAQKVVYEFTENVNTILWCLSETSNKALNAINQINLVPFLMSFLAARAKLPIATVTAAAQCLYVLTDDNQPAIDELRSNAAYSTCLLEIVHDEDGVKDKKIIWDRITTLKVLSSGILSNVSPFPPPSSASGVDVGKEIVLPLLQPVVASVSLTESSELAESLVVKLALEPPQIEKLSLKNAPKSDHRSDTEVELDRLENKLRTVQLALEILTGMCATLPDPEPIPELQEGEPDAEEDEDNDGVIEEDVTDGMALDDIPITNGITTASHLPALVEPLITLIQPVRLSFPPAAGQSSHPPTTSVLSAIHVSALECLNNIFLSLSASPSSGLAAASTSGKQIWDGVWAALGSVGTEITRGQERKQEMWEIGVGVLWGVGNIWKGSLVPNEDQIQLLIQLCNSSTDPAIRVKCIGTLECLAQHPQSIDANRVIAMHLLSILPTSTASSTYGTEPLIQTLSALIDIYSDENLPYDVNFRQGNFVQRLVDSVEGVRKAVRAIDRRKERDLKLRGEEMRDNLIAFIKYRRALRC